LRIWLADQEGRDVSPQEIAEELRMARHRARLKVMAVAEQIGVDPSALTAWENGRRNPTLDHLVMWAEAFGKTVRLE